jgi:aspartyl protease family protein
MIARYAVFAILVIGFALAVIPREGAPEEGGAWVPEAGAKRVDAAPAAGGWSGDQVLTRRADGHFYASTYVNGAEIRMLVDTGASVIALTGADAEAAGLIWDESEVRPIARGASGTVYGVYKRLDEVAVGDLAHRNVDAVIVPRGLDVSLLGQSYLGRLARVDISGERMELSGH